MSRRPPRSRIAVALAGMMMMTAGGCGSIPAAGGYPASGGAPTATGAIGSTGRGITGGPVVAAGAGWSAAGLDGPAWPPGHCHAGRTVYQGLTQPLPDPRCTPGATDGAVTPADLATTICRPGGYTASVRPPESLTEQAKRRSILSYGVTGPLSDYEYDHLVPLGLGGASDTRNLWPERDVGGGGAYAQNAKDAVENDLHDDVCSGRVALGTAQRAIAVNWTTALTALGLSTGPE